MKTIVHVLPYMAKGGTEKHVLTLLRGFQGAYRSVLFAPRGEILDEFQKLGIPHVEFPELRGNVIPKIGVFKEKLRAIAAEGRVDLVHVHAAHEFVSFARVALHSVPIVFHLSAHQGSSLSRFVNYTLSARIARRKADVLIAVSEEEMRIVIARGFPREKVEVVYNGYESGEGDDQDRMTEIKRAHGLENSLVVGNLGRFHRTKRLDLLIEAFARVRKGQTGPVKLLLIGDGPDRERLEQNAKRLGLGGDVVFAGFIPRGDRVLKLFDLFVLPTTFEGCSNVLVEAMAKGLPILTTDIPSVSWMFRDGEHAVLFRKDSVDDLAAKLGMLVRDRLFRERIGKGAFARYRDRFTAGAMVKKVDLIYRSLLP